MGNSLFQDSAGNVSSKRVFGGVALAMAAALAVFGILRDSQIAANLVWPFISFAGAVLGVSVAERRP